MSIKLNRYQADEAGPWSINANIMNIKVAETGIVDLAASYLGLRTAVTVTDSNGANLIYPVSFADLTLTGANPTYVVAEGQSLVRDYSVGYSKTALANRSSYQNVYRHNMDWYTESRASQKAKAPLYSNSSYNYGTISGSGLPASSFIDYSRPTSFYGAAAAPTAPQYLTTLSYMKEAMIPIPMKHIDQLAANQMHDFPSNVFGDRTYSLTLENFFNVVAPCQMPQGIGCADLTVAGSANFGTVANPIVLTEKFASTSRLNDVPLYVGAPITLKYKVNGGAVTYTAAVISGLAAKADGTIYVTTVAPITAILTTAITALSISYRGYLAVDPTTAVPLYWPSPVAGANIIGVTASWQVNEAHIYQFEKQMLPEMAQAANNALQDLEMPYLTVELAATKNVLGGPTYNDTVSHSPNTVGIAVMTPQTLTLTSGFDNVNYYRRLIGNYDPDQMNVVVGPEQETATQLSVGRQYHNWQLKIFLANIGESLSRFDAPNANYTQYYNKYTRGFYPLMLDGTMNPETSLRLVASAANPMVQKTAFWFNINQNLLKIKRAKVMA
jgi:hypothetical protein